MEVINEEYIDNLIKKGYIARDGSPLKCQFCDSEEQEQFDKYYDERSIVEYAVRCKNCKKTIGRWGYGSWQL